jgi:predicted nucleic acid-binding Zn ribbon protein
MTPKLKARVIAEWRGMFDEPTVKDTARPISEPLQKLLAQLGLKQRVKEEEISAAWKEVVGDFLAKHAAPARLSDGLLIIHVLQPTVHFELERVWKRTLLQKLQARFGRNTIREIRFRLG